MFSLLDKRGNSNYGERIAPLDRFIKLFGKECIDCISADREFVGEKRMACLNRERIRYYLGLRNNFKVFLPRKNTRIPVSWLFSGLKAGQISHYPGIVKVNGQYCYISATMSQKRGEKPELLIIISCDKNGQSFLNYKERCQIETCFRTMKSSGSDMENTHLKDLRRIEKLLCPVMTAFVWCYIVGDYLDKNVKAIIIKKHGHRVKSVFKYGLEYISNCLPTQCRKQFKEILSKLSCSELKNIFYNSRLT